MKIKQIALPWYWLIAYILLVSLLCRLGFWQLSRAEQKQLWIDQQAQAMQAAPVDLNQLPTNDPQKYQPVKVKGRFDSQHTILLDNQISEGRPGYWVFTPFRYDAQRPAVLINRGWIAMNPDRSQLPVIETPEQALTLVGRSNDFPLPGIELKNADQPTGGWPAVVQILKPAVMAHFVGYMLADFQLELSPDAEAGFKRQWQQQVVIPPEKHRAYAVQWFGLALTLTLLSIWLVFKNYRERST